jgi:hypothetical protein
MVFSDTTTKLGLIQDCETTLFGDSGYGKISGNTNLLYQFTGRINRRQDRFIQLAFKADGTFQYDDSNNTDYPEATTNLISGQRDYVFALDMLEIERAMVYPTSTSTDYTTIYPRDIHDAGGDAIAENQSGYTGVPNIYDKKGALVTLGPKPNYSATNGLKVIFKRGAYYFVYSDTTRSPGFASYLHGYLSKGASLDYAVDRGLDVAKNLSVQVDAMEKEIVAHFARRPKDEVKEISGEEINSI